MMMLRLGCAKVILAYAENWTMQSNRRHYYSFCYRCVMHQNLLLLIYVWFIRVPGEIFTTMQTKSNGSV